VGDTALDQYPYVATAVAIQESELYVIERTRFELCVKKYPEVAFMILDSVIRKARNAALQVGDLSLRNARGRVAHVLIKLSDEIGTETEQGIVIQKKITHETLAGLTGLARPTLTSVLNDLERAKVITKKNHHVIITDKKKLLRAVDNILD
jgi:CRP/FNR family transcriptional regulator